MHSSADMVRLRRRIAVLKPIRTPRYLGRRSGPVRRTGQPVRPAGLGIAIGPIDLRLRQTRGPAKVGAFEMCPVKTGALEMRPGEEGAVR